MSSVLISVFVFFVNLDFFLKFARESSLLEVAVRVHVAFLI